MSKGKSKSAGNECKSLETVEHLFSLSYAMLPMDSRVSRDLLRRLVRMSNKRRVKLSCNIKRSICAGCYCMLIPSVTCTSKIVRDASGVYLKTVCGCGEAYRLHMRPA